MLWSLAERHIWIAIGLMGAGAVASWQLGQPMWTVGFCFVTSALLMRVDVVNAPAEQGTHAERP